MNPSSSSIGESSLLLWLLAAAVAVLAAHVYLGWVREAQRQPSLRDSWVALLLASLTLGTGICAAVVVAISAEALTFMPGYQFMAVPALWLGAITAVLPPTYWLMHRQNAFAIIGCGVLLGGLAIVVQSGWLAAAGFRPGIHWRVELVAGAAALGVVGMVAALWVAFGGKADAARRRALWRIGAGVLMGLALIGGQEALLAGARLLTQVGSIFKDDLPAPVLALAGGVLAPLVMAVMALDLELRNSGHRRIGKGASAAPRRRRRKQRIRTP